MLFEILQRDELQVGLHWLVVQQGHYDLLTLIPVKVVESLNGCLPDILG